MNENLQGWINLYKPTGISSFSAIYKIKKKFKFKKIGHAGTLDPNAEGILPVAVNKATKLIPFINSNLKEYYFKIKWGQQTTTDDAEGEIIKSSSKIPTVENVVKIIENFVGNISQVPPKASAIKINGKRAYTLLRDKKEFHINEKKVFLKKIKFLGSKNNTSNFFIECGKGFYVRSLARDLANKLGTFGHATEIKRTKVGNFNSKASILLDDLLKIGQSELEFNFIYSSISMLDDILAYEVEKESDLTELSLGKKIFIDNKKLIKTSLSSDNKTLVFLSNKGNIVSFGEITGDMFQPHKVLT